MKQVIRKLGERRFHIFWRGDYKDVQNSNIELDFSPFLNTFGTEEPRILIHWQSRPKGLRRWGIYDLLNDEYYCSDYDKLFIHCIASPFQVDENRIRTIPTAVFVCLGKLIIEEENLYIKGNGITI
jgi:hypothetical protein